VSASRLVDTNPPKTGSDHFRITEDPVVKDGVFPYMGSFRAGFEDPPLQTNLSISRKVWKLLSRRCV